MSDGSQISLRGTTLAAAVCGVALSACLLGGAVASAHAIDRHARSYAISDDRRYTAFLGADGTPVSLDTLRNRKMKVEEADGCLPRSIGSSRILLNCPAENRAGEESWVPPRVGSAITGKSRVIPGAESSDTFFRIGRHWALGLYRCESPSCSGRVFVNLQTGERKVFGLGDYWKFSLNYERLRREPRPAFIKKLNGFQVATYNRRFVVTDDGRFMYLWRSARSSRIIGRSSDICCEDGYDLGYRIANGRVSWVDRGTLHVVATRGRQRYSWKLGSSRALAAPVKKGIVVSVMKLSARSHFNTVIRLLKIPHL